MLEHVGRFMTNSSGVIHISSKEDFHDFMLEVEKLSEADLERLPLVVEDYKKGDD